MIYWTVDTQSNNSMVCANELQIFNTTMRLNSVPCQCHVYFCNSIIDYVNCLCNNFQLPQEPSVKFAQCKEHAVGPSFQKFSCDTTNVVTDNSLRKAYYASAKKIKWLYCSWIITIFIVRITWNTKIHSLSWMEIFSLVKQLACMVTIGLQKVKDNIWSPVLMSLDWNLMMWGTVFN
jgi:hypothetical protein